MHKPMWNRGQRQLRGYELSSPSRVLVIIFLQYNFGFVNTREATCVSSCQAHKRSTQQSQQSDSTVYSL